MKGAIDTYLVLLLNWITSKQRLGVEETLKERKLLTGMEKLAIIHNRKNRK
jgi:hypothetical protein